MKKGNRFGFTILETLVATAIILVVAAVIFQLLTGGRFFYGTSAAKVQAQEQARFALGHMVRELKEASSPYVYTRNSSATNGSYKATTDNGTYSGDSIFFKVPCRYETGAGEQTREIIQLDDDGSVVFGAKVSGGVYQSNLWIEYCLVDVDVGSMGEGRLPTGGLLPVAVAQATPTPTPEPTPTPPSTTTPAPGPTPTPPPTTTAPPPTTPAPEPTPTPPSTTAPPPTTTTRPPATPRPTTPPPPPTCFDECSSGSAVCDRYGDSSHECGNYDADPCTEWHEGIDCEYGCVGGVCRSEPSPTPTPSPAPTGLPPTAPPPPTPAPCFDECSSGSTVCDAGGNYSYTCGNYDADPCWEWDSGTYCEYGCSGGVCRSEPSPTTTAPPIVGRQLRRRVWNHSNIDFGTLNISGTPLEDRLIASNIGGLTFRAFQGDNPEQLEVTVVGWGWDSSRRKGVTSSVTSEVIFRSDIGPQIP